MAESFAGTHQGLRLTPSVLRTSTSLYSSPTEAGVVHGDLRFGPVIQKTMSSPTPRYPRDRATRSISARRSIISRPPAARALEDHLDRRRTCLLAERDGERAVLLTIRPALLAVHENSLRRRDATQLQAHLFALGNERALAFANADGDALVRRLTGDHSPRVLSFCVSEAVSRIFVKHGFSRTRGGVDEQHQGIRRPLVRVGCFRTHRCHGIRLDVEGGLAEGRVRQEMYGAVEAFAAPVVEPGALGQVDVPVLDAGAGYRGYEEGVAEQELVVCGVGRLVLGVLEQEGAQDRGSRPVALFEERVQVRKQPLAELYHLPANGLVGLAEDPRLLAAGTQSGVVAAEGLEDPELVPAGEELAVRVAPEAADVDPGPSDAGEGEVLELGHAHPQVLPPGGVVSRPLHGVALQSGVAGAGDHERTLVGTQGKEAFTGGAGHEGAVGVVDLGVPPGLARPSAGVDHVVRHRGPIRDKERRLVHVAPDPCHSCVGENTLVLAPPLARLGVGEVREGAHAGPDGIVVLIPIARLAVQVFVPAICIDGVVLVHFHSGVYDSNDAKALLAEVGDQTLRVGEAVPVPGEDPVAVHVVDVEVDDVAGDVPLPETAGDLAHLFFVHVGVTALLVSDAPQRRHRGAARELGVAVHDFLRGWPAEDVVDDRATLGPVVGAVFALQREVELDPVGVVEEESLGPAVHHGEGERDGAVEVVEGGGVPERRIDVVEDLVRSGLLQPARPLAAAEVSFSRLAPLVQPYRATEGLREHVGIGGLDGAHPELNIVYSELAARGVREPDAQGVQRDVGRRCGGRERELLVGFLHGDLDRLPVFFGYGLGVVSRRAACGEHPDAEEVWGQGCNLDRRRTGFQPKAVVVVVEQLSRAEGLVFAARLGLLLE